MTIRLPLGGGQRWSICRRGRSLLDFGILHVGMLARGTWRDG